MAFGLEVMQRPMDPYSLGESGEDHVTEVLHSPRLPVGGIVIVGAIFPFSRPPLLPSLAH